MNQHLKALEHTDTLQFVDSTLRQIRQADDPAPIVRALAPHDLLLTWKSADDEQRADLLHLAEKEQVSLLVDLDCWNADRPDLDALEDLMTPLMRTGLEGSLEATLKVENELRTLLIKRRAVIHLLEDKNDPIDLPDTSEVIVSPDGYYYIEFPDPEIVTHSQRELFRALFILPFHDYHRELEAARHEMISELEETAYQFRRGRLADYGFAVREEAIGILTPRAKEDFQQLSDAERAATSHTDQELRLPVLFGAALHGHEFLDRSLEVLLANQQPGSAERLGYLGAELTALSNRYMAATGVEIGDMESVTRNLHQVRNLVALGLIHAAEARPDQGARLLLETPPGHFLQLALGLLYPIRDRARQLLREPLLSHEGVGGAALDPFHRNVLEALTHQIPLRYGPIVDEEKSSPDLPPPLPHQLSAFADPSEVEEAVWLLEEIEAVGSLVERFELSEPLPRECFVSQFILTILANASLSEELKADALTPQEAERFAEEALDIEREEFFDSCLTTISARVPGVESAQLVIERENEDEAKSRALVRLLQIGRRRLETDEQPWRVLITR